MGMVFMETETVSFVVFGKKIKARNSEPLFHVSIKALNLKKRFLFRFRWQSI